MSRTDQVIPDREALLNAMADINVALARSGNSPPHWQAVDVMGKAAEIITSPEFGGITREDDGTFTVLERRPCMGGYSILTTNRPTALEALVAVYDELKRSARRS